MEKEELEKRLEELNKAKEESHSRALRTRDLAKLCRHGKVVRPKRKLLFWKVCPHCRGKFLQTRWHKYLTVSWEIILHLQCRQCDYEWGEVETIYY